MPVRPSGGGTGNRNRSHGRRFVSSSRPSFSPTRQPLSGGAITDVDTVSQALVRANSDPNIHAIILDVNSPGGTPVAGDEILGAVLQVTEKPIVAVVRDVGASAAYWAIAGADYIVASPVSDVGSIGVTMSYTESAGALEEEGGRWVDIASGSFKDAGNPERMLREEEKVYFQTQVDTIYMYMVQRIASARPSLDESVLAQLADGRAFLGTEAKERGLVDALGGFSEALVYITERTGKEAVLCEASIHTPWWW